MTVTILALAGSAWVAAGAGIIELGRKGHTAGASSYTVIVEGHPFPDPNHMAGELAETILGRILLQIDNDPAYTATLFNDPLDANRNSIRVVRQVGGGEVSSLAVEIEDTGIRGSGVESESGSASTSTVFGGVNAVNGDGLVIFKINLTSGGVVTCTISTAGKSAAQVNQELRSGLLMNGFTVSGPINGPFTIFKPGDSIRRVTFTPTDTGVTKSSTSAPSLATPPVAAPTATGSPAVPGIPTASETGLLILILSLSAAAVAVLIRRR